MTDWQAIRGDYESGMSFRALAAKYDVSKTYLIERRNKDGWNRPERPTTDRLSDIQRGTNTPPNRDVNAALRVAEALKLRAQKLTYQEIAQRCGYANAKSAHRAIQRELERLIVPNVERIEELRREEAHIYDVGHSEIWLLFMDRKNKGRLFAWDRILETSRDRRKLLGLDTATDAVAAGVTIIREYSVEVGKV